MADARKVLLGGLGAGCSVLCIVGAVSVSGLWWWSGRAPDRARAELQRRGVPYSEEEFCKRVAKGDTEAVVLFVRGGIRAEGTGECPPALHVAAVMGYISMVEALLKEGLDPNITVDTGTPLMAAAGLGRTEIVRQLLAAHANPASVDSKGRTALSYACSGVDLGFQALMIPMTQPGRGTEAARLLIKAGADVNHKDNEGTTPLMLATEKNEPDTVRLLLDSGGLADARDNQGRTALAIAVGRQDRTLVSTLLAAGAKVEKLTLILRNNNTYSEDITVSWPHRNAEQVNLPACGGARKFTDAPSTLGPLRLQISAPQRGDPIKTWTAELDFRTKKVTYPGYDGSDSLIVEGEGVVYEMSDKEHCLSAMERAEKAQQEARQRAEKERQEALELARREMKVPEGARVAVRLTKVDDHASVSIDDQVVATANYGEGSGGQGESSWVDISTMLRQGPHRLRLVLENEPVCCGVSVTLEIKIDGATRELRTFEMQDSTGGMKLDEVWPLTVTPQG